MFAELLDAVAAWLWTFAVHGTVIVAAVAALALLARRVPSREESLWRYAIVAGLVTASFQAWLGPSPFAPLTFTVPTTSASSAAGSDPFVEPEPVAPPLPKRSAANSTNPRAEQSRRRAEKPSRIGGDTAPASRCSSPSAVSRRWGFAGRSSSRGSRSAARSTPTIPCAANSMRCARASASRRACD